MRHSCLNCARKHLSKAYLYLCNLPVTGDLTSDLRRYYWLAIANLDEAEEETLLEYYNLATTIRETIRLPLMDQATGSTARVMARDRIQELIRSIDTRSDQFKSIGSPVCVSIVPDNVRENAFRVAKATVLVKEAFTGYPAHLLLAIQELRQVQDTCTGLDKHAVALVVDALLKGEPTDVFSLVGRFLPCEK